MTNDLMSGDERRASWKVLLPFVPGSKILVLGGEAWLVRSLGRSCAKIDWLYAGRRRDLDFGFDREWIYLFESLNHITESYDVVIIADQKWLEVSAFENVITFLQSDGILVHVGLSCRPWDQKKFFSCGLKHYHFLSALPVSAPRLFFPLVPLKFCQASLSFHTPGSLKARFGVALLKIAAKVGWLLPLKQRGIVFCSRAEILNRPGTLALWLSEKLSLSVVKIAVYCGSDSPRRKMTLLVGAVGPDGRPVSLVVKVADTEAGNTAIQQESETLRYLVNCKVECEFPQLLLEGYWNKHSVQVQQAFPSKLDSAGASIGDDHLSVLQSFSNIARELTSITATREWQRVQDVWRNSRDSFPPALQSLWEHCLSMVDDYGDIIPVHFVHGDFASWNMRCQNGRLAIFDWEDSFLHGLPFYDLFRFLYRQASLVGPWPGSEQFCSLLMGKIESLERLANFDSTVARRVVPLLIMVEYLERPNSDLLDIVVFIKVKNG